MFLGLTRAALPCLLAAVLSAADNPFVGQWKLNIERTKLNGQTQTIRDLGGNKYEFDDGAVSYTIVANGTDQPLPSGATMSLKPEGDHSWTASGKKTEGSFPKVSGRSHPMARRGSVGPEEPA